ncbi:DUF6221 family protein [Peterkaempfera sp. SMS 1(5)a]|uniref:DUF6221 family protein n=1 Tax=Peterkaempfera podocarpi TaxID=3232308 RepID=UPI00366C4026
MAFLRARLDDDEQTARAAGGRGQQAWETDFSGEDPLGLPSWPAVVRYTTDGRLRGAVAHLPVMEERSEDRMAHIARHDPRRVLAEVDAKRRIIAEYEANSVDEWPLFPLFCLALPYASHPDYRPEWAPDA